MNRSNVNIGASGLGAGATKLEPSIGGRDLLECGLNEVREELLLSGNWNKFIAETINGDEIALEIVKRQVLLSPDEVREVYRHMILSVCLNVNGIKDQCPHFELCDRRGRPIGGMAEMKRIDPILKRGPPHVTKEVKKRSDEANFMRLNEEYYQALETILDVQFHLNFQELGSLKKLLIIYKGDKNAIMGARPTLSYMPPMQAFPASQVTVDKRKEFTQKPEVKAAYLKSKEPPLGNPRQNLGRDGRDREDRESNRSVGSRAGSVMGSVANESIRRTSTPIPFEEERRPFVRQPEGRNRVEFSEDISPIDQGLRGQEEYGNHPRDRFSDDANRSFRPIRGGRPYNASWRPGFSGGYQGGSPRGFHPRGGYSARPRTDFRSYPSEDNRYFDRTVGGDRGRSTHTHHGAGPYYGPPRDITDVEGRGGLGNIGPPRRNQNEGFLRHEAGRQNQMPEERHFIPAREVLDKRNERDLNASVVFREPESYEKIRSSVVPGDYLDQVTMRLVNTGLLSREEAAKAHLEGAILKESMSRRDYQGTTGRYVQKREVLTINGKAVSYTHLTLPTKA